MDKILIALLLFNLNHLTDVIPIRLACIACGFWLLWLAVREVK